MSSFVFKNFSSLLIFLICFCMADWIGKVLHWVLKKLPSFVRKKKNEKRILIYNHIIQSLSPCVDFLREKDADMIFNDVARARARWELHKEKLKRH